MIEVNPNIIGETFSITANGPVATKIYKVTTTANESQAEILLDSNIPQYGEIHPNTGGSGEPLPIYALQIDCECESEQNAFFRVTVNYSRPDFSQKEPGEDASDSLIQVGSTVSASKTQVDKDGNQIFVTLSGLPNQTGEVEIQVPETVLLFERRESANPLDKAIDNAGFVNSTSLGSGSYAARTLLCLGIDGTSTDDGETWQVTYRFQYRPDTWDSVTLYIDPETDLPHEDVVIATSTGVTTSRVYPEIDFSSLNLPF